MGISQRALSGSEKRSLSVGRVGGRPKQKNSIFHPSFSQEIISVTHNARFLKAESEPIPTCSGAAQVQQAGISEQ